MVSLGMRSKVRPCLLHVFLSGLVGTRTGRTAFAHSETVDDFLIWMSLLVRELSLSLNLLWLELEYLQVRLW